MMGETGPCGPCSEIHMDLTPQGDSRGTLVNQGRSDCLEIWNLVFIQFNAGEDGQFTPLTARHVDTGMGFERVCGIVQGTKHFTDFRGAISNYESDLFRPLFDRLERLSGRRYGSTLPKPGTTGENEQERIDIAFRILADHIRTLSFAIADGILPGNADRGYVLRRILRRAVRYGRTLGFQQPFFFQLVDVLVDTMDAAFPELRAKQKTIEEVVRAEEESFHRTIDRGIELFQSMAGEGHISGESAFKLYDTYGFPLDLTMVMARERGLTVDADGFERLMAEQKARARSAQKKDRIEVSEVGAEDETRFIGYDETSAVVQVLHVVDLKDRTAVVLDVTPCYAERGGQVGDLGELKDEAGRRWRVIDTQIAGGAWLHLLEGEGAPAVGQKLRLTIDLERRRAIQRHHTATHLLHGALHEVVGPDAIQKGSYVGPDKLTFDFSSASLTPEQTKAVEKLVNERILANDPVSWREVPRAEVEHRTDIRQVFGETYGERVRVLQVGGRPGELDGWSMELCGGTHVRATGEIGQFRILAESSVSGGIRRIEAVCGLAAWEQARKEHDWLHAAARRLSATPEEVPARVESLLEQAKKHEKELRQKSAESARGRVGDVVAGAKMFEGIELISANVGELEAEGLRGLHDAIRAQRADALIVLGAASEGRAFFITSAPDALVKRGIHCGKLIGQVARLAGGGGGGQPGKAQAGGKDPSGIPAAMDAVAGLVRKQLGAEA